MPVFEYTTAFSRNLGWVSPQEQEVLKNKTVAIAGMGGVGGMHLLTLCRLGMQNFHIADPDCFELANFNRQVGATMSTIGMPKTQTLLNMAKEINPNVHIKVFGSITQENVEEFLSGCDIYVDGMDFFAVDTRQSLFMTCENLGIPAVTAAPLGMGVNYLIFDSSGMSFMDYFQWHNKTAEQKALNFAIGLAPNGYHARYLVDPAYVDFKNQKGPSTIMSCMLCAGVMGVCVLKTLLKRGKIYSAPYYHVFDPYLGKFKRGYLFLGNKNPLQKLKYAIVNKMLNRSTPLKKEPDLMRKTILENILDLARWAPSGDNTQPWRFQIISAQECRIIVNNSVENDIYDFDGKPTLISIGCLMETIRLAANHFNQAVEWKLIDNHNIDLHLIEKQKDNDPEQLATFILYRSVNRSHYQKDPLPPLLEEHINGLMDDGYSLQLFDKNTHKEQIIHMNMLATQVRLVLKEAHHVHQKVIQWEEGKTDYGIPYNATGLSKLSIFLMRRLVNDWNKMSFINEKLGGAFFVSLELDWLPGKNTAAFLAIHAPNSLDTMTDEELITAGMQIQRTWLYLTKMNIALQPCYMPIILAYYQRHQKVLSDNSKTTKKIARLEKEFSKIGLTDRTIFIARIGYAKEAVQGTRSTRLTLDELILPNKPKVQKNNKTNRT